MEPFSLPSVLSPVLAVTLIYYGQLLLVHLCFEENLAGRRMAFKTYVVTTLLWRRKNVRNIQFFRNSEWDSIVAMVIVFICRNVNMLCFVSVSKKSSMLVAYRLSSYVYIHFGLESHLSSPNWSIWFERGAKKPRGMLTLNSKSLRSESVFLSQNWEPNWKTQKVNKNWTWIINGRSILR